MKRIALALLPLLAALGCAAPPPPDAPATLRDLPGVSRDGAGAACATEMQSCSRTVHCCSGLICQPHGRYGHTCFPPFI